MRAVVQRVQSASVKVEGKTVASSGSGLLVFLAVTHDDTLVQAKWLAGKICRLRIFEDVNGKMNKSVVDVAGEIILVSQFTLYGDCRKGNRPGFSASAKPEIALSLYEEFADLLRSNGVETQTGVFGAHMDVSLVNDGPVTLIVDTP